MNVLDRNSNVERLAGWGLVYVRWTLFKYAMVVVIFGIFFLLFLGVAIVDPNHVSRSEAEKAGAAIGMRTNQIASLDKTGCLQKGFYWTEHARPNLPGYTHWFCTERSDGQYRY